LTHIRKKLSAVFILYRIYITVHYISMIQYNAVEIKRGT